MALDRITYSLSRVQRAYRLKRARADLKKKRESDKSNPIKPSYPGHHESNLDYTAYAEVVKNDPNKNDKKEISTKPPKIVWSLDATSRTFLTQNRYDQFDPDTNRWTISKRENSSETTRHRGEIIEWIEVDPLPTRHGMLFFPSDREIALDSLKSADKTVTLKKDAIGNVYFSGAEGAFQIGLRNTVPTPLEKWEKRTYQKVRRLPENLFPEWVSEAISRLHPRWNSSAIDSWQVADRLSREIKENLSFSDTFSGTLGVLNQVNTGKVESGGAASLLAYLLRAEFGIACRLLKGSEGQRDPLKKKTKLTVPGIEIEARLEVYNPKKKMWKVFNPTPENPDKSNKTNKKGSFDDQSETSMPSIDDDQLWSKLGKPEFPIPGLPPATRTNPTLALALQAFWEFVSTGYSSGQVWLKRMVQFQHLLDSLDSRTEDDDLEIVLEYQRRMKDLEKILRRLPISYSTPQELSLEIVSTGSNGFSVLLAMKEFLLLSEKTRRLSDSERVLLNAFEENGDSLDANSINNKEFGDFIWNHLPGPLTKEWLRDFLQEGPAPSGSDIADAARSGKIDSILRIVQAHRYLNLASLPTRRSIIHQEPTEGNQGTGSPEVSYSESLEDWDRTIVDGLPPKFDLLRLLGGEMPIYASPDRTFVPVGRSKQNKGTITVAVVDISSSMEWDQRHLIRDAILLGAIDRWTRQCNNHHVVVIPYNSSIQPSRQGVGRRGLQELVSSLIARPLGFGGLNNSSIALAEAYRQIKESERKRANILWITDGEESIETEVVVKAREELPKNVHVSLLGVNLITPNSNVAQLALESLTGDFPRTSGHRSLFISREEVHESVDIKSLLASWEIELEETKQLKSNKGDLGRFRSLIANLSEPRSSAVRPLDLAGFEALGIHASEIGSFSEEDLAKIHGRIEVLQRSLLSRE